MELFLISMVSMGGLALLLSVGLVLANQKLRVEVDPKVERITQVLPGINCGACGSASCEHFSERVVGGTQPVNGCVVGGSEVAAQVAEIMGTEVGEIQEQIAMVHCGAAGAVKTLRAKYQGIMTCRTVNLLGGDTACSHGCLGYGDCVEPCQFDAIHMVDGIPRIDPVKCTACGQCAKACPRGIITIEPIDSARGSILVACGSTDPGRKVRQICKVGCIACRLCQRNCSDGTFKVEDNLSKVDYSKALTCSDWDVVIEKCPPNTIVEVAPN